MEKKCAQSFQIKAEKKWKARKSWLHSGVNRKQKLNALECPKSFGFPATCNFVSAQSFFFQVEFFHRNTKCFENKLETQMK